jgi:hypothetical protein
MDGSYARTGRKTVTLKCPHRTYGVNPARPWGEATAKGDPGGLPGRPAPMPRQENLRKTGCTGRPPIHGAGSLASRAFR